MINIVKGRDKEFTVRLVDKNDEPIDLTGWSVINARFLKDDDTVLEKFAPLTAAVNEVQGLSGSAVPDSGAFTLKYLIGESTYEETASLAYDDDAAAIQTALNNLQGLTGVTVTGSWAAGFVITFAGNSGGRNQPLLVEGTNTLLNGATAVTITISSTTAGSPQSGVDATIEIAGKITVYLSEVDTDLLKEGVQDFDLQIKVGSSDLHILPQIKALNVQESSF